MRNPHVRQTLTMWTLWGFVGLILLAFSFVLLPFGIAVLVAFIIEPIVLLATDRPVFRGKTLHRGVVVIGIYLLVAGLVSLFLSLSGPQIGREIAKLGAEGTVFLSNIEKNGIALIDWMATTAEQYSLPVDREEIEAFVSDNLESAAEVTRMNFTKVFTFGRDVVASLFGGVFGLFLVLMLTAFLSIDRFRIETFARSLVPPESRDGYQRLVDGIAVGLAGVVRGQLMICLTNGVLTFIGLALLGVKFKIILATLAAVFSLVPIFGSIISTIPIVAVALTDSLPKAFFALLWVIGIHLVEANLLNPKIMGDAAKIHPVLVVFALLVGEQTAGLIGALFAVPIASVVFTFFKFVHQRAIEDAADKPGATSPAWARQTGSGTRRSWDPPPRAASGVRPARPEVPEGEEPAKEGT